MSVVRSRHPLKTCDAAASIADVPLLRLDPKYWMMPRLRLPSGCTTSIIYRVIGVDGWRKSLKTYRRLTEILVESSVLYTAIYVMRIGLQIYTQYITERVDERARFAQALAYSITGIAPTLVIARLAAGYGRPDDSWTRASLPHMPTTMRSLTESLRFERSNTSMDTADLERSATNSTLEDESTRLLVV